MPVLELFDLLVAHEAPVADDDRAAADEGEHQRAGARRRSARERQLARNGEWSVSILTVSVTREL